jgi:hypothetical protein
MKFASPPMALLIVWCAISSILFMLGVGFAGGFRNVFTIPEGESIFSISLWAASWIFFIGAIYIYIY